MNDANNSRLSQIAYSDVATNAGLLPTVSPMVKRLTQNAADELTAIQTKANPGVQNWTEKTPAYDDAGNLTSDGDNAYGYDYENRLVSVVSGSESAVYYYAGDGSRVAAVTVGSGSTNTTVFVLDHADPLRRPLAELDENGALIRRFVWGRGVVAQVEADGTVHYFHHDGQGSTLALTDTNNVPTDAWFYSPYGEVMTRTGTTDTPYQWCGGLGLRPAAGNLYFARHRYYHIGLQRWIARDPLGMSGGPNLYAYAMNAPFLYYDPLGLWSWNQTFGVIRAGGGLLESAAGYSLATASAALGAATSWTGVGLAAGVAGTVGGVAVGAHGIDQFQAGIRQAFTDSQVDSFTSEGLQMAGMSQGAANLTDAGISVVGSVGAGLATAGIKVATVAARDPLAKGLNAWQVYSQIEKGSMALIDDEFRMLGGTASSPLAKAQMMQQGVDALGRPFTASTTYAQSVQKAFTWQLLRTGPSPGGNIGVGAMGAMVSGTAAYGNAALSK